MQTVAIAGVGLIGGSFGLALRKAGFTGRIVGVSSPATIEKAKQLGAIDEGAPLDTAVAQADLVYLAQPIGIILEVIPKLAGLLKPGALVTDAGSTKLRIVETARASLQKDQFLGGHPMAGKAERGVAVAEANLFEGRPYVLAGPPRSPVAEEFRQWLDRIGAQVVFLDPRLHDELVAAASHVPQLLSTALAASLGRNALAESIAGIAGPGLIDMTRLAGSDYGLWRDILETNAAAIGPALDKVIAELQQVRQHLDPPDLEEPFRTANRLARGLRNG